MKRTETNLFRCAASFFVLFILSIFYFSSSNRISLSVPGVKDEGDNSYQVYLSNRKEQWDHSNILVEPRLNFILRKEQVSETFDSINEPEIEEGLYSLRLDGADLRRVMPLGDLEALLHGSIKQDALLKRSVSNRHLALVQRYQDEDWLTVIDLARNTAERVGTLDQYSSYYWLHDQEQVFYISKAQKLMLYDPILNEHWDISERFRLPTVSFRFELYSELNALGIFNDRGFSLYNFETGALLKRSSAHPYNGFLAANPAYRYTMDYITQLVDGEPSSQVHLLFFQQGYPQSRYRVPLPIDHTRPVVEFGPEYVYQAKEQYIRFLNAKDSRVESWVIDEQLNVENLSLSYYLPLNYKGVYCRGNSSEYRDEQTHFFDACGLSFKWNLKFPERRIRTHAVSPF